MSEIALYNALKKIDGVTDKKAKEAVADVASSKEVATKADIAATRDYIDVAIAKLETRMTWKMVVLGVVTVGLIKYL